MSIKKKAITAENQFTDAVWVDGGTGFNLSVWGTFVATVTVQRSSDGSSWRDIPTTYTAAIETAGVEYGGAYFRAGVKTGGFTSGTVNIEMSGGFVNVRSV